MYLRDGIVTYAPVAGDPRPVPVVPRDEIPLPGDHNVRNAMAALLAAIAVGCPLEALREAIASFEPMPHRLVTVAEIDGVRYVDDSKATNPASVIAALNTYDCADRLDCRRPLEGNGVRGTRSRDSQARERIGRDRRSGR